MICEHALSVPKLFKLFAFEIIERTEECCWFNKLPVLWIEKIKQWEKVTYSYLASLKY